MLSGSTVMSEVGNIVLIVQHLDPVVAEPGQEWQEQGGS